MSRRAVYMFLRGSTRSVGGLSFTRDLDPEGLGYEGLSCACAIGESGDQLARVLLVFVACSSDGISLHGLGFEVGAHPRGKARLLVMIKLASSHCFCGYKAFSFMKNSIVTPVLMSVWHCNKTATGSFIEVKIQRMHDQPDQATSLCFAGNSEICELTRSVLFLL